MVNIKATKSIKNGDEIFVDYGPIYEIQDNYRTIYIIMSILIITCLIKRWVSKEHAQRLSVIVIVKWINILYWI